MTGAVSAPSCAAAATAAKTLSLIFTVTSAGPIQGAFPATLTYVSGTLTGTITTASLPCVLTAGSTDKKKQLKITCSVASGLSTDTYVGTLGIVDGRGKGKFTDSFYSETGTYTVAPAAK